MYVAGELRRSIHRPGCRMKSQIRLSIMIGCLLFALGISLFLVSAQNREPAPHYPATVYRDCAPWDGGAFTLSIPLERSVIQISIYRSPDIRFPITFSFPDETMETGNAMLMLPVGRPTQLKGKVSFPRVGPGSPVEGQFDLLTDTGQHFKGKFKAVWENTTVYCG